MNNVSVRGRSNTFYITRIAVLGVIAFLLMFIKTPLTFVAPFFMEMDFSDMPVLIGAFAMGPLAGVGISLIKNILHLAVTNTLFVGELSNFIVGSSFAVVASLIYTRNKTFKTAIVGLVCGTLAMSCLAVLSNYFIVFPLYANTGIMPMDKIIEMGSLITGKIVNLWTMMLYSVLPFNLIKGSLVSFVTILVYKRVSKYLHR